MVVLMGAQEIYPVSSVLGTAVKHGRMDVPM